MRREAALRELEEAAVDLADYWPSLNIEKHYSPKMQRFLRAVRALAPPQRTEEPSDAQR